MEKEKKYYIYFGILVILLWFIYVETVNPFYFLEDDNFSQFAPTIIEGMKQLFSGYFPGINIHQLMGSKIFEIGTYAIFYPPMIISYIFANYALGNSLLIFEVFVLIHLLLGFVGSFYFLESKTKNNLISTFASFAFVFSGYFQISKGWYYVAPLILFLPLIFLLNDRLILKNKKNVAISLGIMRGIFYYAGNSQYFAYLLIFEFIYFLLNLYQQEFVFFFEKIKKYISSLFITIIISLPLIWAQLINSFSSNRGNLSTLEYLLSRGALPTDSLLGSLISPKFLEWSPILFRYAPVQYSGTLFSALFFFGGVYLIWKYKKNSLKKISPLFWCAIISMLLSWGIFGLIYSIGAIIPLFSSFQGPYKIIPFFNFFTIAFGAVFLSQINKLKRIKEKTILWIFFIFLILLILNLSIIFGIGNGNDLKSETFDKSFFDKVGLEENFRIVTVITNTSFSPKISSDLKVSNRFSPWKILSKNYATYFNLDSFSGYEPFEDELTYEKIPITAPGVYNKNLNLSLLEEYSVRYIVLAQESKTFHTEFANLSKIFEDEDIIILETKNPKTYVFYEGGEIEYKRKPNGFEIGTDFNKSENITINLLYKENYQVTINGKSQKFFQDELGRILIGVSSGKNLIKISYFPKDFLNGILLSLIILIIFLALIYYEKGINKFYYKFNFSKILPFIKNNFEKIIPIIIILFFVFLFILIFSSGNIEKLIESKFNIETKIEGVGFDILNNQLIFKGISLKKNDKEIFNAKKISFKPDYLNSLKTTIRDKKLQIIFSEIYIYSPKINLIIPKKENKDCSYPMTVKYPLKWKNLENIEINNKEIFIKNLIFIPINKAFFSFEENFIESENLNFSEILIKGNIKLERYLHGEIIAEGKSEENIEEQICIILPKEDKNPLYI